ncbi:MAG: nuclear transport factor 2 family protein [Gemmatimonadota bacterium]|nr:nuclear transport factor 2 family protein [Gemmatimonadota bacterium]MDH3369669.1 nuclear transport factor 2 family protein [Gemmatimonadota bacterium]MDH3478155.1 nuclear transport factor 2 family protein [Gemmatimonadota bacterium]MDH3570308.1 nuclear transport factor 2 family protein [Gemmatimonadota bacterium]MDH5551553.1 nuclear transport factor 2 family protein [Gemmatimonadota bacterium]
MTCARHSFALLAGVLLPLTSLEASAQARPVSEGDTVPTAQAVVHALYDLVTFEAGTTPDWDAVRSLFLPQAVIVLRTSRTATTVFTVDGFVDDFVQFIERANVEQAGFVENILRTHTMVFKDMAHVLVLYEASIPGSGRPPQQGVDSFQLIRQDGRWRIAAVLNDIPDQAHPVPAALRP